MRQAFREMLKAGGKSNSLGRVDEVIELALADRSRLQELYDCLFASDTWVRMRAADAFEKICRQHPDWIEPYIDRFAQELATSSQPSIQWHLAQMYRQVTLTTAQRNFAMTWLKRLLATPESDWIVAANAMATLVQFTQEGFFPSAEMVALLEVQQGHRSPAVVKRANKFLAALAYLEFTATMKILGINPYVLVTAEQAKKLKPAWRKPMPVLVQVNNKPNEPWRINMMPTGGGDFYLYLSNEVRQASGTKVGDEVGVKLWFDVEYKNGPMHEMPPRFRAELERNPVAARHWDALPPSRQKEVLRYLAALKSDAALQRNIDRAMSALSSNTERFMGRDWKAGK